MRERAEIACKIVALDAECRDDDLLAKQFHENGIPHVALRLAARARQGRAALQALRWAQGEADEPRWGEPAARPTR